MRKIVTCDEKWIAYDNKKQSKQWSIRGVKPGHTVKTLLHGQNILVTVWWAANSIVHC